MLVVRPCKAEHPNAVEWSANYKSAAPMCRLFYDSLGWEQDYSFRIPCRTLNIDVGKGKGDRTEGCTVLIFDMDNYVGRTISKKEEIIIARKAVSETREDAKSYYYPPDANEPQEIRDMEQKLEQIKEINKRIFGTPFALHASNLRTLNGEGEDMMAEAVSLDIAHTVDTAHIEDLMHLPSHQAIRFSLMDAEPLDIEQA